MKWKVCFTLGRRPMRGNHISEHKTLFTSQQLKFRGVNVLLGTQPKCTYNYGLKDSMNLGHTTLNLQQNSCWCQYNLCPNFTRQLSPVCIQGNYYAGTFSYLSERGRPPRLISSSDIIPILPPSLQNQHHFSIFCKQVFFLQV